MGFLGFIKNGTKGTYGLQMPAFFPASRVTYDNTNHPDLPNRVQGAIDEVKTQIEDQDRFNYGIISLTATGGIQSDTVPFVRPFTDYAYVNLTVKRNASDDSPFNGEARLKSVSINNFTYTFKGNAGGAYDIVYIAVGH